MKIKNNLIGLCITAFGMMVIGMGIALSLLLGLGVDPVMVCFDGLSKVTGITPGSSLIVTNILVLIFVIILKKKHYINIATLMIFMVGVFIDFFQPIFANYISGDMSFIFKIALMLLSILAVGYGVSLYTSPNIGVGATDLISVMVSDIKKWKFKWVRISVDTIFLLIGCILGGEFGVGTVAAALLYGPVIQFFNPINQKMTNRLLERQAF